MNNRFSNLAIGTRLGAGFVIILLLLCSIGVGSLFLASRIYDGTVQIADSWLPSVEVLGDVRKYSNNIRRFSQASLIENDPAAKRAIRARHAEELVKFEKVLETYQKLVTSAEEEQLNQGIKKAWSDYVAIDRKLLDLSEAGEGSQAEARAVSSGESLVAFRTLTKVIDDDIELNSRGAAAAREDAGKFYKDAVIAIGVIVAIALVVSICIGISLTRSITVPLRKAVSITETVTRGDLTSDIDTDRRDEVGQLLQSLKTMNSKLSHVVSSIRTSSESITVASDQIATGNLDLSSRTEEQAASLEETAASMAELTETVRQNGDNANQANSLATSARMMTDTGRRNVEAMVATINQVSADSEKVADITGMIEGIAFQTNILALNAAVEAARAGEQGRGFAVVAGEVRSLAQRASAAAKEIKELIEASTERVRESAQKAGEVNAAMGEIDRSISRVSDVIAEISAASSEQTRGINQVHQAISQIDEATQQNAALVEESAAAAQSMREQADKMKHEVMFFKLGNELRGAARSPTRQLSLSGGTEPASSGNSQAR